MCGIIVNERDYRRELDESNLKLDSSSWYYEVDPVRTRAGQRRPWLQPRRGAQARRHARRQAGATGVRYSAGTR